MSRVPCAEAESDPDDFSRGPWVDMLGDLDMSGLCVCVCVCVTVVHIVLYTMYVNERVCCVHVTHPIVRYICCSDIHSSALLQYSIHSMIKQVSQCY